MLRMITLGFRRLAGSAGEKTTITLIRRGRIALSDEELRQIVASGPGYFHAAALREARTLGSFKVAPA